VPEGRVGLKKIGRDKLIEINAKEGNKQFLITRTASWAKKSAQPAVSHMLFRPTDRKPKYSNGTWCHR